MTKLRATTVSCTASDAAGNTTTKSFTVTVVKTNLQGANLQGFDLAGASLPGVNLEGANLLRVNAAGADFTGAELQGANLQQGTFTNATFRNAHLNGANLQGANLTGADLTGATTNGANLHGIIWSNTTCPDGTNSNVDGGTCQGHLLQGGATSLWPSKAEGPALERARERRDPDRLGRPGASKN